MKKAILIIFFILSIGILGSCLRTNRDSFLSIDEAFNNNLQLYIYYRKENIATFSLPTSPISLRNSDKYDYLVQINTDVLLENKQVIEQIFNAENYTQIDDTHIDATSLCDFVINEHIVFSFGLGVDPRIVWVNGTMIKVNEFNIYHLLREKFIPWDYYFTNKVYEDIINKR